MQIKTSRTGDILSLADEYQNGSGLKKQGGIHCCHRVRNLHCTSDDALMIFLELQATVPHNCLAKD